jgi:transcription initiation factor IIE alpha subunit
MREPTMYVCVCGATFETQQEQISHALNCPEVNGNQR